MIVIVVVLCALPLGWFLPGRLAALTAYSVLYLWAFTYQSLYLLTASLDGGPDAIFTAQEFPLAYGGVTLAVLVVGAGLVLAGHRLRARSRGRAVLPVG